LNNNKKDSTKKRYISRKWVYEKNVSIIVH
jgi:hypothetical protein